jgi:hypothetical protein
MLIEVDVREGQSRHSDCVPITSDLPRKADKFEAGGHFGKVPEGEVSPAIYSITS